jgi:hypothetical protein
MFTVKFKDKIPCDNEIILASDLAYYLYYLHEIPEELADWQLDVLNERRNKDEKIFTEMSKKYSDLFKEYALIKLKANELYERNRVVALTMGLVRQKLINMKETGIVAPLDYDIAIAKIEHFIYRYLTKKQDERLVEQIVFDEK